MKSRADRPRPFANILCPIDFSEHSRAALRLASELASDWAVRMTVLYVHDPTIAGVEAIVFPDGSLTDLRVEIKKFAATVMAPGRACAPTTRYVAVIGKPDREILRAATRLRCDLIVMGSRGLGGFKKLVLGSTTDRIVHHAAVPVLAVRSKARVRRRTPALAGARPLDLAG
jgi:nucleotide-binding universal stress UspA family protein